MGYLFNAHHKCYGAKYRVKSENYTFSSSHVFYIALFRAILNWQIFANPENRGQVVFAYLINCGVFSKYSFIHIFC